MAKIINITNRVFPSFSDRCQFRTSDFYKGQELLVCTIKGKDTVMDYGAKEYARCISNRCPRIVPKWQYNPK